MLMKVVNINYFDLEIQHLNLVLNALDVGLSRSFRFSHDDIENRASMLMPNICHAVPFGRMHFFMAAFKECFKHLDALWLF